MSIEQSVIYLGGPHLDQASADLLAQQQGASEAIAIGRRGYQVGWIAELKPQHTALALEHIRQTWPTMDAIVLPGFFKKNLAKYATDIEVSQQLAQAVLDEESCADLFAEEPYASRLAPKFELLAASCDESDDQEIETIDFDVMDGEEILAEGLWMKASWLSFAEDDISLRFRFSFGIVGYEDVAADYEQQTYAAELTEAIFPQSAIISQNDTLQAILDQTLNTKHVDYVERIIYFNAPDGGAQFHQDVERGHLGVVFAQMHGRTGWLALSKAHLIDEILLYLSQSDAQTDYLAATQDNTAWDVLCEKSASRDLLNCYLDEADNEPIEHLINRVPSFAQQLIDHGYGYVLNPGDAILLPQQTADRCCWHSVFCLDDYAGQALSFAIRTAPV